MGAPRPTPRVAVSSPLGKKRPGARLKEVALVSNRALFESVDRASAASVRRVKSREMAPFNSFLSLLPAKVRENNLFGNCEKNPSWIGRISVLRCVSLSAHTFRNNVQLLDFFSYWIFVLYSPLFFFSSSRRPLTRIERSSRLTFVWSIKVFLPFRFSFLPINLCSSFEHLIFAVPTIFPLFTVQFEQFPLFLDVLFRNSVQFFSPASSFILILLIITLFLPPFFLSLSAHFFLFYSI